MGADSAQKTGTQFVRFLLFLLEFPNFPATSLLLWRDFLLEAGRRKIAPPPQSNELVVGRH
jgi:hypothetical protein